MIRTEGSCAPIHMPFKFQSKYYDQEFGLYNFGLRFYDPSTCKWLNRDPIGESGGLNLYAYCDGDPINGTDVLGCGEDIDSYVREIGGKYYSISHYYDTGWLGLDYEYKRTERKEISYGSYMFIKAVSGTANAIGNKLHEKFLDYNKASPTEGLFFVGPNRMFAGLVSLTETPGAPLKAALFPVDTAAAIKNDIAERWKSPGGKGTVAFDAVFLLTPVSLESNAARAGTLAKTATQTEVKIVESTAQAPITGYMWNEVFKARYGASNVLNGLHPKWQTSL
ncbi:MAG TPA: hypothetical protein DET40_24650 [Lentisphaeria bacterium]|nr:hypothetical protein [Lentisphaeria bacterium]